MKFQNKEKFSMEPIINDIYEGIIDGDKDLVKGKVEEAINTGMEVNQILEEGLIKGMTEVGRLFEEGEFFVPEMLISARAMQAGMDLLKPLLLQADVKMKGKVVIGTVKGDLHDIGKNLVAMMLEGAAFEVVDLGTDVAPDKFVTAVQENGADLVAMSALLTTTMPSMKETINALNTAGLRDKVKIMVGGAPLTPDYATEIGADGYSADANQAVSLAKSLVAA
jgi:5-methyltetrahydrofolate--homocysteine methyltransferase